MRSFLPLTLVLLLPAGSSASPHRVSVQGGWWSLEAEYRAPFGLFVDAGIPWFALVLDGTTSGTDWVAAAGAKLGYEYDLSDTWKLRAGFRTAFSFWHGSPCMDCAETETKSFALLELGIRYVHGSGFVTGITLPLHVFDDFHEMVTGDTASVEHFYFPFSLLFSQVYLGWVWSF